VFIIFVSLLHNSTGKDCFKKTNQQIEIKNLQSMLAMYQPAQKVVERTVSGKEFIPTNANILIGLPCLINIITVCGHFYYKL